MSDEDEVFHGDHFWSGMRVNRVEASPKVIRFVTYEEDQVEQDQTKRLKGVTGHFCRTKTIQPGASMSCPKCNEGLAPVAPAGEVRAEGRGDKEDKDEPKND